MIYWAILFVVIMPQDTSIAITAEYAFRFKMRLEFQKLHLDAKILPINLRTKSVQGIL